MLETFIGLFLIIVFCNAIFALGFCAGKKSLIRKPLKIKAQSVPVSTGRLQPSQKIPTVVQASQARLDKDDILNAEVIE